MFQSTIINSDLNKKKEFEKNSRLHEENKEWDWNTVELTSNKKKNKNNRK
jgi:hypothetical protein